MAAHHLLCKGSDFIIKEVLPETMEIKSFMKQRGDRKSGEDCKYKCDKRLGENICQQKVINVCPET